MMAPSIAFPQKRHEGSAGGIPGAFLPLSHPVSMRYPDASRRRHGIAPWYETYRGRKSIADPAQPAAKICFVDPAATGEGPGGIAPSRLFVCGFRPGCRKPGGAVPANGKLSVSQAGIYRAFPPETLITCPVIILACSLDRNKIVSAISSG